MQQLPKSTAALVFGILSLPLCFLGGIPGLICGTLSILYGTNAKKLYVKNPNIYDVNSLKNAIVGRTCGIIGLILSTTFLVLCFFRLLLGDI